MREPGAAGRGWCASLLGLLALVYFAPTASTGFELRDEGFFLALARRAAEGELPHRDFVDIYGPAIYLLNGALLHWFDMQVMAVRWSIAIVKALTVAGLFVASDLVAPRRIAVLAGLLAIAALGRGAWNLNAPYAALHVIALAVWSLVLVLRGRQTRDVRWWFAAGLLAGAAVPFKQSLAAMNAVALVLMILTSALLEAKPPDSKAARLGWRALLLVVLLVPLAAHLPFGLVDARGYVLFLLPAQVMGVLVLAAASRAPLRSAGAGPMRALVALGCGGIVVPGLLLAVYAWQGAAAPLVASFLSGPGLYANYIERISLPPVSMLAWLVAAGAASTAAILALEGRRPRALVWGAAAASAALVAIAMGGLSYGLSYVLLEGNQLPAVLPIACSYALLWVCGRSLLRDAERPLWLVPTLYVFFWHHAMTFQVFPRAGFNLVQGLAAFVPALAAVLAAWWRSLDAEVLAGWRRGWALGLLALPALWPFVPAIEAGPVRACEADVNLAFAETSGIRARNGSPETSPKLRAIVEYLERQPRERPVFAMNNDWAVLFLSGRRPMFAGDELRLYLMLWGMLDPTKLSPEDEDRMIETLSSAPDALIVTKSDESAKRLRRYLPELTLYVDREFVPTRKFGAYQVLERR